MSFTRQELEDILRNFDDAIALRELHSSPGWLVYRAIARTRIENLSDYYLKEDLTQEAAWIVRERLKAIKEFQKAMDDMVAQAAEMNDKTAIQQMLAEFYGRQNDDTIQ